jgi:putative photosynthetic complex assembly protein
MTTSAQSHLNDKAFATIGLGLAAVVVAVGVMRLGGYQPDATLPAAAPQDVREIAIADGANGDVIVRDGKTGAVIVTLGNNQGNFIRMALRALVHDQQHQGFDEQTPFRLERQAGGQLFLIDEATGKALALNAFGPANAAAFAAFLSTPKGEGQ